MRFDKLFEDKPKRKVQKAAMRIGGKLYTGMSHPEIIDKARREGKSVPPKGSQEEDSFREKNGLFLLSDGKIINRQQAEAEFGKDHSEQFNLKDKPEEKKGRKFVIVTKDFSGLGFALDERNKGDKIVFAVNPDMEKLKENDEIEEFDNIGEGMIARFPLKEIMTRRSDFKDYYWVWDGNHSVEENELLRKEGFKVCLGGKRAFDLENDRESAIKLAEKYGLPSPEWKAFTSPEEGIAYLEAHPDKCYVCKPNNAESHLTTVPRMHDPKKANERMRVFIKSMGFKDYILQEMVKGIEVNAECFFVDGEPKSASVTLESKRVSSDDTGSLTGCAFDICKDVAIDSTIIKATIGKMFQYYKDNKITGLGDANVIISGRKIYFVEKCERIGFNTHENYFINIEKKDMLNTFADMHDKTYKPDTAKIWGASICIYVDHPHKGIPMEVPDDIKKYVYLFDGMKKDGILVQTGASSEIAIVCGSDYEIKGAFADALEKCEKMRDEIINLDFRKDCIRDDYDSSPIKRWRSLEQMGYV
ncbi:MAG: hypothetical protein ABSE82_07480 [Nitrososphaerales archaeon]|jgi:phosphoribosylamine-glycine ligase